MLFRALSSHLLQFADAAFGRQADGARLFTWWGEAVGKKWSELTLCAAVIEAPGFRDAAAAKGFIERSSRKKTFLLFREAQGQRPMLPGGREPRPGDFFLSAFCLADAEGRPVDAAGALLTTAPADAERWSAVTTRTHGSSPHWEVTATGV